MKTLFIVIQLLLTSFVSNANNSSNDIMGNWLMANKNVIVEVYKTDNQYFGKVIWMDKDANKKNFSVGDIIFDKMQYNPDTQKYVGGNFYGRGHKLSCELRLIEKNRIEVKVSKGILHQIRYCSRVN